MAVARFRFYEELNDFIAADRRRRDFDYACARTATVKHAIEALGVPHSEVELVVVNGESVDFAYRIREGDRISVYPKFEAFDVGPVVRVRAQPLRVTRFIADSQLGGLARRLRMLGFDTLYENSYADQDVCRRAVEEGRIILTRDRELLKIRSVTHGLYVRASAPQAQLREVVQRLQLAASVRPLTLCLYCNVLLVAVDKKQVLDRLPPRVAERCERFHTCPRCERVYWEGSHWERMRRMIEEEIAPQ